jgi:PAS domain S-box-containing protein
MSARAPVGLSGSHTLTRIDRKFSDFLESVPDAMVLSDRDGRIVLMNTNTERMFGYSRDELMGKEIETLVPERSRAVHREDRAIYYAAPGTRRMGVGRELSARGKDGVEFPVEISLAPVEIRGRTFIWSAIRDIADREYLIAQLRESMKKKRLPLRGFISICAWCKRVRDTGEWLPLEKYITSHSKAKFTHGICRECLAKVGHRASTCLEISVEGDSSMTKRQATRLYMVVEHFKDAEAVYQRLWEHGRIIPEGLVFVTAWIDENVERSYRLMQTHDRRLLEEWMASWNDLIDFEVYPVTTPEVAGEKVAARMRSRTSRPSARPV